MQLVDTHCHLDIVRHFPDYEQVLDRAKAVGVSDFVLAGVVRRGWPRLLELCREKQECHAAPGLHPMYLDNHGPGDVNELSEVARSYTLAAIGEIGLDYHVAGLDRDVQQQLFEVQLDIATANNLPVLLHVRKAHDQVLATLRRKQFVSGGIVHAYNGSLQQAEQYCGLGFMIGVCGTLTFERSTKIRRVASALPLESLVLETDAPDIPPANHWGQRNSPEYLPQIAAELAGLHGVDVETVSRITTENAHRLLGLH